MVQGPNPGSVAIASFANMFSVGTLYALSILQAELHRLLNIPRAWSFVPFAVATIGLSIGVATCTSVIERSGGRTVTAAGTILWGLAVTIAGHFLAFPSFKGIIVSFIAGGVGVGWTYLAVIAWIGECLPAQSLARTAIGPLGFSSGAAACTMASCFFQTRSLNGAEFGTALKCAGTGFITVGVTTLVFIPANRNITTQTSSSPAKPPPSFTRAFFQLLLLLNSLPGMTVFAALLPVVSSHTTFAPGFILPWSLLALALGGILSPTLSARLSPSTLFTSLFCLRSVLLTTFSQTRHPAVFLATILIVFFAHGVGFSTLPAIIKSRLGPNAAFSHHYGLVLTTWGLAGVVGSLLNAFLSSSGDFTPVSLVLGLTMFASGCILGCTSLFP
ncbi:major facilitator superfamily domain-containing protein [Aspergillus heterothallicus]